MSEDSLTPDGSPTNDILDSEELASRLVEFDESLKVGLTLEPSEDPTIRSLPNETRARVDRLFACLKFIHEVRREEAADRVEGQSSETLPSLPWAAQGVACDTPLVVGRFEIGQELGRGAHGVVFQARDQKLDRQVAVKFPRPDVVLSPQLRRRLAQEGKTAARLHHPNIVTVLEAGDFGPCCYIAQELCTGPSLSTWLAARTEPVPFEVAVQIMISLAKAIEYAHSKGVLHRDLKPSNVLLQPSGPADASSDGLQSFSYTVKLTDFGIAKVLDEEADGTMTLTGAVMGTAAYMAPEQAAGQRSKIGEVTDVYGLGAILYELLTDTAPFEGDFPADVLRKVIEGHPLAPRRHRADVPRDLEAMCLRCLETAPQHRYATAQQFAEDLERFLAGRRVLARPVTPLLRTLRRWQRQPRPVQLIPAISFALLTLAATGLSIFVMTRDRGPDAAVAVSNAGFEPRTQAQYESDVAEVYKIWRTSPLRFDDNRDIGNEMERLLVRDVPKAEETDRRGFEWHYLWKLAHPERYATPLPEVLEMKGHNDVVYFVTFSANGSRIATANKDHTARVWDAKTGRQVCVCQGHTDEVSWVDFSPEGKLVATAGDDSLVKLWDAESGKELVTFKEHTAPVVSVVFCPTSRILASGDKKGMLILWDVATRKSIRSVKAHQLDIQSLNWSSDGRWLLTAGGVDRVKIWDANNLRIHHEYVFGAASAVFNRDASLIASGSMRAIGVVIDDVPTGRRRMLLKGHTERVQSVRFSPDGLSVASCSNDGSVRAWDLMTRRGWQLKRTIPGRAYWCLAFSPDGTRLAVCGDKNVAEIGDTSASAYWTYLKLEEKDYHPKDLAFMPQSDDLVTIGADNPTGVVRKWKLTQQLPKEVEHDEQELSSLAFSYQSGFTKALGLQREIRVLRTNRDGVDQRRFETPVGAADFLRIAKNGHDVFAVAASTPEPHWSVKRLNADSGTETWSLEIPRKDFTAIAFSADDQLFALSRLDGRIELFDASSATKIKVLGTDRGPAHCLAFSPTQRRLASSTDQGVRVWDTRTNQALANLTSEHQSMEQVVYFPDGMRLATVCRADRTIRIWSMVEGNRELLTLPFPPHIAKHGRIGKMAISPDGKSIACFGTAIDGKWGVYLWQINPESANGDHRTTIGRSAQPIQPAQRILDSGFAATTARER